MLLHAHAVNEARAAGGRAPVTSVWFWGGGRAADAAPSGTIATWGGDRVAVALASAAGAPARALPQATRAGAGDRRAGARRRPARGCRRSRASHPASSRRRGTALLRGQLSEVTVIADGTGAAWRWSARRPGFAARVAARAGWRRPALAPLLDAARDP